MLEDSCLKLHGLRIRRERCRRPVFAAVHNHCAASGTIAGLGRRRTPIHGATLDEQTGQNMANSP